MWPYLFSLGLHSDCAVNPDDFAINHFVGYDVLDKCSKFIRVSEARRVRHGLSEEHLDLSTNVAKIIRDRTDSCGSTKYGRMISDRFFFDNIKKKKKLMLAYLFR